MGIRDVDIASGRVEAIWRSTRTRGGPCFMLGGCTPWAVLALFAWGPASSMAQLEGPPCEGVCTQVYQGSLIDFHFHLPLGACTSGQNCGLDECDTGAQTSFVSTLIQGGSGEADKLDVTHLVLQGAANDNHGPVGYPCVFSPDRDTERKEIADSAVGAAVVFAALDGFDPGDSGAGAYVASRLDSEIGWKAVGEVHLKSGAYARDYPANILTMSGVYAAAAGHGVPVGIHYDPANAGGNFTTSVFQLNRALITNPGLKVVWFHYSHHQCRNAANECGDCNIGGLAGCIREMLHTWGPPDTNPPRLYLGWEIDSSVTWFPGGTDPSQVPGGPLLSVLSEFPDQIVLGADIGDIDTPTGSACNPLSFWRYRVEEGALEYLADRVCDARRVLGTLDSGTAYKIAYGNAARLLGLSY